VQIDTDGIERDRDAIWQAAALGYDQMREEQPYGTLPLFLKGEASEVAKQMQERARKSEAWENWMETITDWMEEEHTLQTLFALQERDPEELLDSDDTYFGLPLTTRVQRVAVTQKEAFREVLGLHGNVPSGTQPHQLWERAKTALVEEGWEHKKCRIGGVQQRWLVVPDITGDELARGFRICDPAQAPGIGSTPVVDDDYDDLL